MVFKLIKIDDVGKIFKRWVQVTQSGTRLPRLGVQEVVGLVGLEAMGLGSVKKSYNDLPTGW